MTTYDPVVFHSVLPGQTLEDFLVELGLELDGPVILPQAEGVLVQVEIGLPALDETGSDRLLLSLRQHPEGNKAESFESDGLRAAVLVYFNKAELDAVELGLVVDASAKVDGADGPVPTTEKRLSERKVPREPA